MALRLEEIRALADRVALSHGLEVVDLEYQGGGGKHRTLRVFIEKNAKERANLRTRVKKLLAARATAEHETAEHETADEMEDGGAALDETLDAAGLDGSYLNEAGSDDLDLDQADPDDVDQEQFTGDGDEAGLTSQEADEAFLDGLPSVSNLELLSGITHQDCEVFSRDFGTVLDVEELVPGTEYLLEVSSPGLDRRLTRAEEYRRFSGCLVKLQTFEAVEGSRHWQGRVLGVEEQQVVLQLAEHAGKKKSRKGGLPAAKLQSPVSIALSNVEKAHLVPEF